MSHPTQALHIPDTQSSGDDRHLAIQRVGIKAVRHPLEVALVAGAQPTVGIWTLDVYLPPEKKGTHMSRFVAWLDTLEGPQDAHSLKGHVAQMLALLQAPKVRAEVNFTFFVRKRAPVSGVQSLLDYEGRMIVEAAVTSPDASPTPGPVQGAVDTTVWCEVAVPVKSLCPCSKEISDYGAHNQRSTVTVRVEPLAPIDWLELVRMAEESASSEVWALLKRPDEKWVTERAYENPKFVEDLVRDVALRLNADPRVGRYRVEVENFESIHNHSAFAVIERG